MQSKASRFAAGLGVAVLLSFGGPAWSGRTAAAP